MFRRRSEEESEKKLPHGASALIAERTDDIAHGSGAAGFFSAVCPVRRHPRRHPTPPQP
jgi:hypothetical protein